MSSPRMMVVCPTSTPATSVIALSGPVGRMPTFRPKSEARGRALEVVLWAKAPELTNRIAAAAKSLLTIAPDNYQPLVPRTALLFPWELKKKRRGLQKQQTFHCACG